MRTRVIVALVFGMILLGGIAYWRTVHAKQEHSVPDVVANRNAENPVLLTSQECAVTSSRPSDQNRATIKCTAKLVNNGPKALRAIALEWLAYDDTGKLRCRAKHIDDYAFPMPGSRGSIAAGEQFSTTATLKADMAKVVVRMIFEDFADGSRWGDTTDPTYDQLTAERMSAHTLLGAMHDAKKTQSADEVLRNFKIE